MADTYTTNLNLTKPEPGAAEDTWGISLNADLDSLDAIFGSGGTAVSMGAVTLDGLIVDGVGSLDNNGLNLELSSSNTGIIYDAQNGYHTFKRNGTNALQINGGNGDIAFYDDSGTSQNLKWDASADTLNFVDNAKAKFGTGSDLQIYHSDSDGASYIKESGSGHLRIQGSELLLEATNGDNFFRGIENGSVRIYHDNSTILQTTSLGIDITGRATADGLTSGGTSGTWEIQDNGYIQTFSRAGANYIRASDTAGILRFDTGGTTIRQKIASNGDISFYDNTGSTQGFFWDASAESLGIGTTSPASAASLHLKGAGGTELHMESGDGQSTSIIKHNQSANSLEFTPNSNAGKKLEINDTGIDITGTVTSDGLTVDGADVFFNSGWIKSNSSLRIDIDNDNNQTDRAFFISHGNASKDIFKASENGDISFYDDTGSTQALFWDASAERLGIGDTTPDAKLTVQGDVLARDEFRGEVVSYSSNQDAPYLIASTSGYTGATTNWNTYGFQHRFKTDSGGAPRVTIDTYLGEAFAVTNNNRVGIGTGAPSKKLHVSTGDTNVAALFENTSSNGTVAEFLTSGDGRKLTVQPDHIFSNGILYFGSGSYTNIYRAATHTFQEDASNTEIMRITGNNVGIGTSSPQGNLHVEGAAGVSGGGIIYVTDADNGSTASDALQISKSGDTAFIYNRETSGNLQLGAGGNANHMIVRTDGKIGIGTTSPSTKLEVSGDNGTAIRITLPSSNTTIGQTLSSFETYSVDGSGGSSASVRTAINTIAADVYGHKMGLGFNTYSSDNTSTQRMLITHDGSVGIGTSSPGEKLTVGGNTLTYGSTGNVGAGASYFLGNSQNSRDIALTRVGSATLAIGYYSSGWQESARFDSSGNFLVSTSDNSPVGNNVAGGIALLSNGSGQFSRDGGTPLLINRKTSDGELLRFNKDSSIQGNIGTTGVANGVEIYIASGNTSSVGAGLSFANVTISNYIAPCRGDGSYADNLIDLGTSSARFDDIYATNGTIQTSDRNEKQDIQALTDAEQRVATACKGLIRRFRWQDAVEEKGDDARLHFGVIAQDLQDAFTAEGLDAGDYGMFISSTWEDDDGVEQTRLGVRYNELLAFIITTL
jgi:hypothetical protein